MDYVRKLPKLNRQQNVCITIDNCSKKGLGKMSHRKFAAAAEISIVVSAPATVKQQSAIRLYEKMALQPIIDEIGSLMGVYEKV